MGSPQAELSLDYKPNVYSLTRNPIGDQPDQTQRLQEFLARLEEERLKIEAFKRELPLCMQLLNNAMETYRQQLETYQTSQGGRPPVLEEFIPLKNIAIKDGSQTPANAPSEKASWMVSAQLWSPASDATAKQQAGDAPTAKETERAFDASPKFALDTKQRKGGAFLPFSKEKNKVANSAASRVLPDLALASTEKEMEDKLIPEGPKRDQNCNSGSAAEQGKCGTNNPTDGQAGTQAHRKARRCWSPDLHRRFVNALQILGGSQVATPKQIRELMKVDGLTNDEVKSHLQKYRLHTRRPLQAAPAPAGAPQLVVLGGIWVPPEYATSAGQAIYGAHPGAAHYCPQPLPQDYYRAPPPHLQPPVHRGAAANAPCKGRLGSPVSDVRSGGERSESIEEGEEGEEREEEEEDEEEEEEGDEGKALVAVRADAAESGGGGGVALKF